MVFINNKKWLKSTHAVLHSSRGTDTCVEKDSGKKVEPVIHVL